MHRWDTLCLLGFCCFLIWVTGEARGSDDWVVPDGDWTDYFQRAPVDDLGPDDRATLKVTGLTEHGPADRAGIKIGDEILAIEDIRVYCHREYNYVRWHLNPYGYYQRLTLRRDGKIIRIKARTISARRVNYVTTTTEVPFGHYIRRMKIQHDPQIFYYLNHLGVRPVILIQRWIKENPANRENLDWLEQFVDLASKLITQQYQDVEPIQADIPIPYFKKLSDFYISVAKRRAAGLPIDPTAHGVSRHYYAMCYPLPQSYFPPLGDLRFTDQRFQLYMRLYHLDPFRLDWPTDEELRARGFDPDAADPARKNDWLDTYLEHVKKGMNDTRPHHSCVVWCKAAKMRKKGRHREATRLLAKRAKADEANRPLYLYCQVAIMSAMGNSKDALKHLKELREISPFMAYLATVQAYRAALGFNKRRTIDALAQYVVDEPFDLFHDSTIFDHIVERSRRLQYAGMVNFSPDLADGPAYQPGIIAAALRHEKPIDQQLAELDEAIAADDFAEQRDHLFTRLNEIAYFFTMPEDFRRLQQINRDHQATGRAVESFVRLVFDSSGWIRHRQTKGKDFKFHKALDDHLVKYVIGDILKDDPDHPERGYAATYRIIQNLPEDREAAREILLDAFYRHGTPPATAIICDELERLGFEEDYQRITTQILGAAWGINHRIFPAYNLYGAPHNEAFNMYMNADRFAPFAASFIPQSRRDPAAARGGPIMLGLARALLVEDKPDEAAMRLIESFKRARGWGNKAELVFCFDGKVTRDVDAYRNWLYQRVIQHKKLTKPTRKRLDDAMGR